MSVSPAVVGTVGMVLACSAGPQLSLGSSGSRRGPVSAGPVLSGHWALVTRPPVMMTVSAGVAASCQTMYLPAVRPG